MRFEILPERQSKINTALQCAHMSRQNCTRRTLALGNSLSVFAWSAIQRARASFTAVRPNCTPHSVHLALEDFSINRTSEIGPQTKRNGKNTMTIGIMIIKANTNNRIHNHPTIAGSLNVLAERRDECTARYKVNEVETLPCAFT